MRFRVVFNKDEEDKTHEALADRDAAWLLWFELRKLGYKVKIFNLLGMLIEPEKGINGLIDYVAHIRRD